jgi:hypothetical protein
LLISGCATPGLGTNDFRRELFNKKDWPIETKQNFIDGKVCLGMTKEQVFWLLGSPLTWSNFPIDGNIYETWSWGLRTPSSSDSGWITTFDFKDDVLIGYSGRGKYFSYKGIEDLRNYKK